MDQMASHIPLGRYIRLFTLVYWIATGLIFAISVIFHVTQHTGGQIGALMASGSYPAHRFAADNSRMMTPAERRTLSTVGTLISLIITCLTIAVVFYAQFKANELLDIWNFCKDYAAANPGFIGFVSIFSLALTWFTIYLGAGLGGKMWLQSNLKNGSRKDPTWNG